MNLTIAICSYTNLEGLIKCVRSLQLQTINLSAEKQTAARLLLVDNAPSSSGILSSIDRGVFQGPLVVEYLAVQEPGIVEARNGALDWVKQNFTNSHLAFVDDDEWAECTWLETAFDSMVIDPAAVWAGPVEPRLTLSAVDTIDIRLFERPFWQDLGPASPKIGDGNVLLPPQVVNGVIRYDSRFNFGGGQDTLFFDALSRIGVRFRWRDRLKVFEDLPQERCTNAYIYSRARANALAYVRFEIVTRRPIMLRLTRPIRFAALFLVVLLRGLMSSKDKRYYAGVRSRYLGTVLGTLFGLVGGQVKRDRRL